MEIKRYHEIKEILTDNKWGPAEHREHSLKLLPELFEIIDEMLGLANEIITENEPKQKSAITDEQIPADQPVVQTAPAEPVTTPEVEPVQEDAQPAPAEPAATNER